MHNIVILGGNFAGVSTAHYLLRHVLPLLKNEKTEYKVTLISPSDHTFFKVGAPRALVSSEQVPLYKPFGSIPDAFRQYKTSEFSFVQGEAIGVDEATKTVSVKSTGKSKDSSVQYDSLVIATGTTSTSPLWTIHGDHELTMAAFEDLHKRLPKAESVLIAGGGPAGVETAGEIAYLYKPKEITILSGTTRLLPRMANTPKAGKSAEQRLALLNVKTIHNVRVISSTATEGGKTTVSLSDGSSKTVDVYIDATGGIPNTSFLPATWLDESKRVAADMSTLRTTKAPDGVYAIGDAASYSKGSVPDASWAVSALGYSIWSDLNAAASINGGNNGGTAGLKEKKYKQFEADMGFVPVGPKGGVGVIFGWVVPSFFVWLAKSRTFMLDKAQGLATGAEQMKA